MGEFFCLLHSSNIAIPWENNFPFKHLLLRRMLKALNASNLGMVVILLELCYFPWSVEPFFDRKRKRKSYSCDQFWLQSLRDENYVLLLMVCQREEFQSEAWRWSKGDPLTRTAKFCSCSRVTLCVCTGWEPSGWVAILLWGSCKMRDVKLNLDQQRTLYVNMVNYMLGYI